MNKILFDFIDSEYKNKYKNGYIPDYEYKSYVLSNNLDKHLNCLSKHLTNFTADKEFIDYSIEYLFSNYSIFALKEACRLINSKYCRVSRLKKRITRLLFNKTYFLTLTFTDKVLKDTDSATRRKYVTRYLKSIGSDYVANIDFGFENNREHFHALVNCDLVSKVWIYGFMNIEQVNLTEFSKDKLSKYITKLTNHAIKETTKRSYIIYPKKRLDNFR